MTRVGRTCWLMALGVLALAPAALAEDGQQEGQADTVSTGLTVGSAMGLGFACLGAGVCTIAGGYAISRIGAQCIDAIARQPEAASTMFAPMIISAAMVEGATLFAIVVCLLGVLKI